MTLTAILVFAAGWCIGYHTGRTLRQASAQFEAMIRPDSQPLTDEQQAILDQLDADLRPHPDDRSSTA